MHYRAHLTIRSDNAKTGPIPVSTTDASTCNPSCGQFETCYAKFGPIALHWNRIGAGTFGTNWESFCNGVRRLPRHQLWRHNQAGDLPGNGRQIDAKALSQLVQANMGKRGFTYTHYPTTPRNLALISAAVEKGFTINLSCDSLTHSDRVARISDLPQTVVLPSTTTVKSLETPEGRKVVVCPATYREDVVCWNCAVCYDASKERAVIGFPAHGTRKKVIDLKLEKA